MQLQISTGSPVWDIYGTLSRQSAFLVSFNLRSGIVLWRILDRHCGWCSGFGELALLYSAPRAATVRASSPCKLWVMDRAVYNVIKMEATQSAAAHKRKLLNAVPLLTVLSQVSSQTFCRNPPTEPTSFQRLLLESFRCSKFAKGTWRP